MKRLQGQSDQFWLGVMIAATVFLIAFLHCIMIWHVWDQSNQTRTELKAQITALQESLEAHGKALTTHDAKPLWWQREGE